jgi:hypothetical protein
MQNLADFFGGKAGKQHKSISSNPFCRTSFEGL